ncbi:MAG: DUF2314 domain-containing protein [Methylobacteriaceae bacterium]|nr:DUF2314 domain-containing protein [Methylobacteriaceae bacterium]
MSKLYMVGGLIAAVVAGAQFLNMRAQPTVVGAGSGITEAARRDAVSLVAKGDPAMEAARAKARAGVDGFLALAARPPAGASKFAVKLAVRDGEMVEYFWISGFVNQGQFYVGLLDNTPRMVKTVKQGQAMTFRRDDIVDWMYVERGAMKGNFTACALLSKESPAEREKFMKTYRLTCAG